MSVERTPAKQKAQELATLLRTEHPDYTYLKNVFSHLRAELNISVPTSTKQVTHVPNEAEIRRFYEVVWHTQNVQDMVMIKTLFYTGVRVSELINIQLEHVDFESCQICISSGKEGKDRIVIFPTPFKEVLAMHADSMRSQQATYLFESSWKRPYSERGIRKILKRYALLAGLSHSIPPNQLRHFLLMWLKKEGIDDALMQPHSENLYQHSLEKEYVLH